MEGSRDIWAYWSASRMPNKMSVSLNLVEQKHMTICSKSNDVYQGMMSPKRGSPTHAQCARSS